MVDKLKWVNYPDVTPNEEYVYYYTHYINHDEGDKEYYKAIFWCKDGWFPWRPSGAPKLTVLKYAPETCQPFYTKCLQYVRGLESNG